MPLKFCAAYLAGILTTVAGLASGVGYTSWAACGLGALCAFVVIGWAIASRRRARAVARFLERVAGPSETIYRLSAIDNGKAAIDNRQSPADPLLDEIAFGMARKPFAKLLPGHQAVVRRVAQSIKGGSDAAA